MVPHPNELRESWQQQQQQPRPAFVPDTGVPAVSEGSSHSLPDPSPQSPCRPRSVPDSARKILVARHLVTPGGLGDDDPGGNDAYSFPWLPNSAAASSPPPDASAVRREEQQLLRPVRRGEDGGTGAGAGSGGTLFSTSHQRVGGEIVRDIYKFVEDGADASVRKRSKSYGDIYSASPGRAHAGSSSVDVPSSDSACPACLPWSSGRSPPFASATMPDITVPGGFRRHFVRTRAKSGGKPRAVVTKDFLDFLSLYGHFAGGYLEDEDDEDARDEGYLPFAEPGLPPLPPRLLLERSPLLPSVGHPGGSEYPGGTANARKVVFLLLKSFVGTGVLFLPRAFFNGGLLFSSIFLSLISALCLHGMLLLVECRTVVPGSFGNIGGILYGPRMRQIVLVSIVMSQLGFCCAYFIFVAQNVSDLVGRLSDCRVRIPQYYFITLQLLLYIPVSMVRKIKSLGFLALVADTFILLGLGYLFTYDLQVLANTGAAPVRNFNDANFSLFIGTAVFTFEGIGLVLPIADSMKDPPKFPKVLSLTMLSVTVLFTCVGALSYAAFGDEVETVILLNLPAADPLVRAVQALYSFAIVFSVPLQMYPAVRIMEAGLWVRTGKSSAAVKWQKNAFRAATCLACALVSYGGASSLDRFTALIGAFTCVPLSFIYPALFHYKAISRTRPQKLKDVALFVFGVVCMIYVTAQTVKSWLTDEIGKPFDRCAQSGTYGL